MEERHHERDEGPGASDGAGRRPPLPGERWDPRIHVDRRRRPHVLSPWRYAFGGRRRRAVPVGDGFTAGVDHYPPRIVLLVVAILVLNALDGIFTLRLVEARVAVEWNPFMRRLLEEDVQLFANLKVAITAGALIFIVVCAKIAIFGRRLRVERILYWILCAYLVLIAYHLMLLRLAGI